MNTTMWRNPITQKNIATLRSMGMFVVTPASGVLACGTEGEGRLPAVSDIVDEIMAQLHHNTALRGKRVLVTAGGTSEPIDDVRQLTNRSTGKMGVALAEICVLRGAHVMLLRSKTSVLPRYPMNEYLFETAEELKNIMEEHILNADICFHVAAVSDFTVQKSKGKRSSNTTHQLTLRPMKKIIESIKKINPNILLVAFKAEAGLTDEKLVAAAKTKRKESHADMVVANHIDRPDMGFGVDTNEVFIVDKRGLVTHVPLAPKRIIASRIIDTLIL